MSASGDEYVPIWDPEAAGPAEVGIDIIEIERVANVLAKHGQRFLERVYTPRERERYGAPPLPCGNVRSAGPASAAATSGKGMTPANTQRHPTNYQR